MKRVQVCGTFSKKEAAHFAQEFIGAAVTLLGMSSISCEYEQVGEPTADEWLVFLVADYQQLDKFVRMFDAGYEAACDFRRVC